MKRTIIFVCVSAMLCAVLCGCGSFRNDGMTAESPAATMDLIPEISPVLTPDMDDGIVNDQDGMIEDHDTGTQTGTVSPSPNGGTGTGSSTGTGTGSSAGAGTGTGTGNGMGTGDSPAASARP